MDATGTTVAAGTWAARKDQKVWKGSWEARVRSGQLYSGDLASAASVFLLRRVLGTV